MKPFHKLATDFASALVAGDFARAHGMLSARLGNDLTPALLCEQLDDMHSYADGEALSIRFDPEFALEEWPGKRLGDVGWAYVGIHGGEWVEAVAVTVTMVEGVLLIRDIQWGRP